VSLRETWPRHGDRVRVLCIKQGGTFRDLSGLEVDTWYGIFVPADKASPEAHDGIQPEAERMPRNTGFRAYVGASWLNVDEGLQAPAC
jgi:hypothetical protein